MKLSLNGVLVSTKNELFHLLIFRAFILTEWSVISLFLSEVVMLYIGVVISMIILTKGQWSSFEEENEI